MQYLNLTKLTKQSVNVFERFYHMSLWKSKRIFMSLITVMFLQGLKMAPDNRVGPKIGGSKPNISDNFFR